MRETANYNFPVPERSDYAKIDTIAQTFEKIDVEMKRIDVKVDESEQEVDYVKHPATAKATLVGNMYQVTLDPPINSYVHNMGLVLEIDVSYTNEYTINVDGKGNVPVFTSKAVRAKNARANTLITLRYSASPSISGGKGGFFLQGEGGSGNAQPNEVLTGKTFTNDNGEQIGTMIKGAYIKSWQWGQFSLTIDELSKTININAVNRNKAIIRVMFTTSEGTTASSFVTGSFLTDSSISFIRRDKGYQGDSFLNVIYEVYEFDDSIKLQWGGTSILNSNVVNITLSPTPNLHKCLLFYHFQDNSNEGGTRSMVHSWRNGNQLNFARGRMSSHHITTIYWWLVEFP